MREYAKYAPTGIVWAKSMPAHWKCDKAKRFFSNTKVINKGNVEKNVMSLTLRGVIRNDIDNPIGLAPADYSTYQIFEKKNFLQVWKRSGSSRKMAPSQRSLSSVSDTRTAI